VVSDVGDAALVLACLLALEPGVEIDDAQLMQGLPFASSRSVLLLRMFASSLQVTHCLRLVNMALPSLSQPYLTPATQSCWTENLPLPCSVSAPAAAMAAGQAAFTSDTVSSKRETPS